MKLIKVTTKHNQDEIDEIIQSSNPVQLQILEKVYSKFDFVEYIDENQMVCMFCIVDDYTIKQLVDNYINFSIDFKFEDLTKDALLCNTIKTSYLDENGDDKTSLINELISNFYENNVLVDDILDKILVKGVESLNEVDKSILESV